MDDRRVNEAITYVREAAAKVEYAAVEILGEFREGRFDPSPVGSPAYVRALRDRAMLAAITGIIARSDSAWEDADKVSEWALEQADSTVRALGYEPPGEG